MSFLPTSSLASVSVAGRASATPGLMLVSVLLGFYCYFLFLFVGFSVAFWGGFFLGVALIVS